MDGAQLQQNLETRQIEPHVVGCWRLAVRKMLFLPVARPEYLLYHPFRNGNSFPRARRACERETYFPFPVVRLAGWDGHRARKSVVKPFRFTEIDKAGTAMIASTELSAGTGVYVDTLVIRLEDQFDQGGIHDAIIRFLWGLWSCASAWA